MNRKRNLTIILVLLMILAGCAGKTGTTPATPSIEAVSYKAITMAYDAYDLGMRTLRILQTNKIITLEQYNTVKDKVGWPVYKALVVAQDAAQAYALAPAAGKATAEGKLTAALEALAGVQAQFTAAVKQLQGGGS
jgi:hypothetical protein